MRYLPNLWEKEKTESWSLSRKTSSEFLLLLLLLFLPTQLGLHFWPDFSYVQGIRVDYLSPTIFLTDILIIILLFINPSFLTLIKKLFLRYKKISFFIVFFLFLNITQALSPLSVIYYLLKILEMVFLFLFLITNVPFFKKWIAPTLAIGVLFESLLGIFQFLKQASLNGFFYLFGERFFTSSTPGIANASIGGELILRPYATFPHPNVLAAYILLGSFIIIENLTFKRDVKTFIYLLSLILGVVTMLLSMGRLPIVLYFLSLCIFIYIKKIKSAVLFLTSIFLITATLLSGVLKDRFLNILSLDQSFWERISLSKAAVEMFYDNLFTGVGLGNFLHELPKYMKTGEYFLIQPVHNIFLLIAAESGAIGLFLAIVGTFFILLNTLGIYRLFVVIIIFLGMFDHYLLTLQQGQLLLVVSLVYIISKTKK